VAGPPWGSLRCASGGELYCGLDVECAGESFEDGQGGYGSAGLEWAPRELGLDPLTRYGALKPAERLAALIRLASIDDTGPPLLVVATDKYIGEGFDCPRLDTVFLTHPLSWLDL
jgi:hypothetical protein